MGFIRFPMGPGPVRSADRRPATNSPVIGVTSSQPAVPAQVPRCSHAWSEGGWRSRGLLSSPRPPSPCLGSVVSTSALTQSLTHCSLSLNPAPCVAPDGLVKPTPLTRFPSLVLRGFNMLKFHRVSLTSPKAGLGNRPAGAQSHLAGDRDSGRPPSPPETKVCCSNRLLESPSRIPASPARLARSVTRASHSLHPGSEPGTPHSRGGQSSPIPRAASPRSPATPSH